MELSVPCRVLSDRMCDFEKCPDVVTSCSDKIVSLGLENEATLPGGPLEGFGKGSVHHHASWVETDIEAGNGDLNDGDHAGKWTFFLSGVGGLHRGCELPAKVV